MLSAKHQNSTNKYKSLSSPFSGIKVDALFLLRIMG